MTFRRFTLALSLSAIALSGCTPGCQKPAGDDMGDIDAMPPPDAPPAFNECAGDPAGFVREASLALLGHRPTSQHEVDAYVALYTQVDAAKKAGTTTDEPRAVVARAMLARPERNARWTAHFMDALRVTRTEDQAQTGCWSDAHQATPDAAIATFIRDNLATMTTSKQFTMLDVARASIAADDPTPMYRAHLFALVSRPIPAANVDDEHAELARREDYGTTFDAVYLNRDIVCLGCHNSEFSITDNNDPVKDRHWPVAGHVDQALFGMATGEDPIKAHAMFRYRGFADTGSRTPWGMDSNCGSFSLPPQGADPAPTLGVFASLMGSSLTVYDLDKALKNGFDTLRGKALVIDSEGNVADRDAALAYVVSTNIVEGVWREVIGTRLTIANYFPRNEASRDLLQKLTDRFIANKYSLDALLVDIVSSDYFARQAPELGCGANAYSYPAVYDPWVIADADPIKHGNGPGDAIAPVSARTMLSAAYAGLEWSAPTGEQFPSSSEFGCDTLTCTDLQQYCGFGQCCDTYKAECLHQAPDNDPDELGFLRSVGVFLKNGERGFRGLDFQARLGWEARFGTCGKPGRVTTPDLIERAITAGKAAAPAATVGDVLSLIKDRLIGEPAIEATTERPAIEALVGQPLSAPASSLTDAAARRFCGVLMSSPQFVLQGMPGRGGTAPTLTLAGDGFDEACGRIKAGPIKGWAITCAPGVLTAAPAP